MGQGNIIEKFGMYFDEVGLNKTYGRMFGIFMTTNEPLSMGKLVDELQISKSTASTELRRLLSMGVIEKVLVPDERSNFYKLKQNIWMSNLQQKIQDVKKLRAIAEEMSADDLKMLGSLKEMADYCMFLEKELKTLVEKYKKRAEGELSGSYLERYKDKNLVIEWHKLSALSETFAEKMSSLADLGIEAFKQIELDFLRSYPKAMEEDKNLNVFSNLNARELEEAMKMRLGKIFLAKPKEFSQETRSMMATTYYYLVTIREEFSENIQGFITFMGGGFIPKNEFKITVLAVDEKFRRNGLASILIQSLSKIGVQYNKMYVSTRSSNAVAIQAYKKWGFKEDLEASKNSPAHFVAGHWAHLVLNA